MTTAPSSSFLGRHEFLIRRLHSLSGLIPVGAYMVVHLLTNASILNSYSSFQKNVYTIHSLGVVLPIVEWAFIFLPILFHAIFGVVIIYGGSSNWGTYRYGSNFRYMMQRLTGMIAFVFIVWHVFHLHGWFHFEAWLDTAKQYFGANFKPYNASSTLGAAMQPGGIGNLLVPAAYAIGILACVYHLANGIWTMGITWGAWTTPKAQQRASKACAVFGIALAVVGLSALGGAANVDVDAAKIEEDRMYEEQVKAGLLKDDPHKRTDGEHDQKPTPKEEGPDKEAPDQEKPSE